MTLVAHHWEADLPLRLYFQGVDRAEKRHQAEAIAAALKLPLLITDLTRLVEEKSGLDDTLKRILREAQFQGALLYLENLDRVQNQDYGDAYRLMGAAIAHHPGIVILAGNQPYVPIADGKLGVLSISFALPDAVHRHELWRSCLQQR